MRYGQPEFVPWGESDVDGSDVIRVRFDRGSVAMGDDTVSHEEHWIYPADATIDDLLIDVAQSVPGMAGWSVRAVGGRFDREVLGILYFRTDPETRSVSCSVCRLRRPQTKLTDLAGDYGLDIYVHYMSSGEGRPVDAAELVQSAAERRPATRVWSAQAAESNWRTIAAIRDQDRDVARHRREWLGEILAAQPDPPGADEFVAAAMTTLAAEICPASLALTASILGIDDKPIRDIDIYLIAPKVPGPRRATLAMVIGAFEFTIASGSWEHGEADGLPPYFDQLERWGWRLSPAELVMAGRMSVADLVAGG